MTGTLVLVSLYGRGGVWQYAARYASALAKKRKVLLICPTHADCSAVMRVRMLKVRASPSGTAMVHDLLDFRELSRIFREIAQDDVSSVHVLDNHPWTIPIMLSARAHGRRVVVTQHDPVQHSGEPRAAIQRILNAIQRSLAHRVIVHGMFLRSVLLKKGIPSAKIVVGAHGLFWFGRPRTRREPHSILFLGRILPYKGLDLLLEALHHVRQEYRLFVVGPGDLEPYREAISALGSKIDVRNIFVSEQEIADWVHRAAIIAMPYRDGSQSGVLPVAYAYGRPVVATKVGSIPEVIIDGKTGLLVKPEVHALARALDVLLEDDARVRRMGAAAKEYGKRKLAWDVIVKQVLEVYG